MPQRPLPPRSICAELPLVRLLDEAQELVEVKKLVAHLPLGLAARDFLGIDALPVLERHVAYAPRAQQLGNRLRGWSRRGAWRLGLAREVGGDGVDRRDRVRLVGADQPGRPSLR